jgi:hypothetical protein
MNAFKQPVAIKKTYFLMEDSSKMNIFNSPIFSLSAAVKK